MYKENLKKHLEYSWHYTKVFAFIIYFIVSLTIREIEILFDRTHWRITVFTLLFITIFGYTYFMVFVPHHGEFEGLERTIVIRKGMTVNDIATKLYDEKVIHHKRIFKIVAKILGYEKSLRAGKIKISESLSIYEILELFKKSPPTVEKVKIIEGWRLSQIASALQKKIEIDSTLFMLLAKDENFTKNLDVPANSLEGFLFPNTYDFLWETPEEEVIKRLVNEFWKIFDESLKNRALEIGFTIKEVITLASIIEGEAIYNSEKPLISSVYHNRLKKNMKLQADPTIQYIIPDSPRRLLFSDLERDSPYNTYLYKGLPPGPINSPGKESIIAALYPKKTDYLYFVARGDGYHTFTKTPTEHAKAKEKLDKLRKELRKKKKIRKDRITLKLQ